MTGVIDGLRWSLLGTPLGLAHAIGVSAPWLVILLSRGLAVLPSAERTLADMI